MWRRAGMVAVAAALGAALITAGCARRDAPARAQPLVIAWAEWEPANYLQTLADDFTAETGIKVVVDQTPWPQYQDKMFIAFAGADPAYDIVVGDSQWLGKCAEGGHYLELTEWMQEHIDLEALTPEALAAYGEYPPGSGRYWAVPAEADAIGFAYRKDLFEDPGERAAFKQRYGRELEVPETWHELRDIAEFFTRPQRKPMPLYGVAMYFGKAYDSVTMGFQQVMWSFGGTYGDPETHQIEGLLNSEAAVKALEFFVSLAAYDPPEGDAYYWEDCLNAFSSGLVAMTMNYFAFFPGLAGEKNPYREVTGYFAPPGAVGPDGKFRRYISLGGQGMSIPKYSRQPEVAKQFIRWFSQEEVQAQWARLGGFSVNQAVLASDDFLTATPYNRAFAESMNYVRDFWAVPEYGDLLNVTQAEWNAAVTGQKTPRQAMDRVAARHTEIFRRAGYYEAQ